MAEESGGRGVIPINRDLGNRGKYHKNHPSPDSSFDHHELRTTTLMDVAKKNTMSFNIRYG